MRAAALYIPVLLLSLLSALAAPADLDRTFGSHGMVEFLGSYRPREIVVQTDGKILVVGDDDGFAVARFNANGSLDQDFGSEGIARTSLTDFAEGVALQPDGKIVVVGDASGGLPDGAFALVRYDADGSLDESFGNAGKVITNIGGGHDRAYSVVICPDGKILAGGQSALVRYNANGSLDQSFGTGGMVHSSLGNIYGVALQTDGKIVVVGTSGSLDFGLARYNVNGSTDESFGTAGAVSTDFGLNNNDHATCLALQPDGKIIAAGDSYQGGGGWDFALARYNLDGSLDQSFGDGGKVTTYRGEEAAGIALQPDGKIIVVGTKVFHSYDLSIVRFNSDGSVDLANPGFDFEASQTDFGGSADRAFCVAIQPDGNILVAGEAEDAFNVHTLLIRLEGGPFPPTATTLSSSNVSGHGAVLKGSAIPHRASTQVSFQFGPTISYGDSVYGTTISGSGLTPTAVSTALTDLAPATTYHFRIVAVNSQGTTYGEDSTFTTQGGDPHTLAPVILNQPAPARDSALGTEVTFEVNATSSGTSSFQWFKGGKAIRGAKTPSFHLSAVTAADAGFYTCVISNGVSQVKSEPALLTLADSGLLIYQAKGTGALNEGAASTKSPVKGYWLLDRANQKVAVIWTAKQGKQKTYWVELRPDLAIHSTGPVPKSSTVVVGDVMSGEYPQIEHDLVWLKGTDVIVKLHAGQQLIAPLSMTGVVGSLTLGGKTTIETLAVSLVIDKASTVASRGGQDDLTAGIERLGSDLEKAGYVKVADPQ